MSSRFPWRREEPNPPVPENTASEQNRAADILSLRLSAPEPPPEFIYQRRPEPESEKRTGRWVGPTILVLLFAISLGVGVLVVRGLKDGLLADNSGDLPVIVAEQEPAKLRAEEPVAPADSGTSGSVALAPEADEAAPPSPSETLQRLLGGRTASEPEPAPVAEPSAETRVAIPAAPELPEPAAETSNEGVQTAIQLPEPRAPAAAAPPPQEATAPPATAPRPAPSEPTRYTIEIIKPTSLDEAKAEWARLQKTHPDLLGDTTLELRRVALEGDRVVYRGLAGYLPSESTALDFCAQINSTNAAQHCEVQARKGAPQIAAAAPNQAATPPARNEEPASSPFVEGASDSSVVRLVKLGLKRAGFDPGPLDGRASPELSVAIEGYQRRYGLSIDGQPSRNLLDHMLGEQVAKIQPTAKAPDRPASQPAPQAAPRPAPQQAVAPQPAPSPAPQPTPSPVANQGIAAVTTTLPPPEPATPAPARTGIDDPGTFYIGRGDEMLTLGDIASARLFYTEAVDLGSAAAKTALGRTYDPVFLATTRISGPEPNAEMAAGLYTEALENGDEGARAPLQELRAWMQVNR